MTYIIFILCLVNVAAGAANIAMLFVIHKADFNKACNEENTSNAFDLNKRLGEVTNKYELTQREQELVSLIYEGKSNADIASLLFISESTVKTHVYNIFRKLNIKNRIQLVCVVRGETIEEK